MPVAMSWRRRGCRVPTILLDGGRRREGQERDRRRSDPRCEVVDKPVSQLEGERREADRAKQHACRSDDLRAATVGHAIRAHTGGVRSQVRKHDPDAVRKLVGDAPTVLPVVPKILPLILAIAETRHDRETCRGEYEQPNMDNEQSQALGHAALDCALKDRGGSNPPDKDVRILCYSPWTSQSWRPVIIFHQIWEVAGIDI
jgi:hypothetical protein